MGEDAVGELAEEPGDGGPVLDVALAQAAGRHAPDVPVVLHQGDPATQAGGGYGGGDTSRGGADNDDVELQGNGFSRFGGVAGAARRSGHRRFTPRLSRSAR